MPEITEPVHVCLEYVRRDSESKQLSRSQQRRAMLRRMIAGKTLEARIDFLMDYKWDIDFLFAFIAGSITILKQVNRQTPSIELISHIRKHRFYKKEVDLFRTQLNEYIRALQRFRSEYYHRDPAIRRRVIENLEDELGFDD